MKEISERFLSSELKDVLIIISCIVIDDAVFNTATELKNYLLNSIPLDIIFTINYFSETL